MPGSDSRAMTDERDARPARRAYTYGNDMGMCQPVRIGYPTTETTTGFWPSNSVSMRGAPGGLSMRRARTPRSGGATRVK